MLAAFGGLDIAGMAGVCIGGALYQAKNNGKKTYRIVGYKEKNG